MSAAAGDLLDRFDHIRLLRGVDRRRGAELPCKIQLVVSEVDGHDIGAHGAGDHDGGEADATTAMHRHPLAWLHAALVDHRAKRRDEATAKTSRRGEIHTVRQANQIGVGEIDGDIFGI